MLFFSFLFFYYSTSCTSCYAHDPRDIISRYRFEIPEFSQNFIQVEGSPFAWPAAKTHILRIKERNHGETITRHSFKENRHDSKPFRESFQPIARRSVGWTCRAAFYQRKETIVHDESHNGEGRVHEATRVCTEAGRRWFASSLQNE